MDSNTEIMATRLHAVASELRAIAFGSFIRSIGHIVTNGPEMKLLIEHWIDVNPIQDYMLRAEYLIQRGSAEAKE